MQEHSHSLLVAVVVPHCATPQGELTHHTAAPATTLACATAAMVGASAAQHTHTDTDTDTDTDTQTHTDTDTHTHRHTDTHTHTHTQTGNLIVGHGQRRYCRESKGV